MSVTAAEHRRVGLVALTCAVLLGALMAPASAAPVNDEPDGAKLLHLGDPRSMSNDLATDGVDDPVCDSSTIHRTLWFRYEPTTTRTIVARAKPLDGHLDIELAVMRSTSTGPSLLACEDFGWEDEAENIKFLAEAGTTYYLVVGNHANGDRGGRIQVDVHRPVRIFPRLDSVAWAKKSDGDAIVTGRARCSVESHVYVAAELAQSRSGSDPAGSGGAWIRCRAGRAVPWLVAVDRYEGNPYTSGRAALALAFFQDSDEVTLQRAATPRLILCTKVGTLGPDRRFGTSGRDRLCGLYGDDELIGGRGRDKLYGHFGRDRLSGGAGRDFLDGGPGRDMLHGGPSSDVCRWRDGRDAHRSC